MKDDFLPLLLKEQLPAFLRTLLTMLKGSKFLVPILKGNDCKNLLRIIVVESAQMLSVQVDEFLSM